MNSEGNYEEQDSARYRCLVSYRRSHGEPASAAYKVFGTSRWGVQGRRRSFAMLALDVTSDESVATAVAEVLRLDGRIDLLVNTAGFSVAPAGAEESSIEQARSIFETNLFGIVRMTRAVVPHMRHQGRGRIINIGSVLGFLPAPHMALYRVPERKLGFPHVQFSQRSRVR